MKKTILPLMLSLALLTACGTPAPTQSADSSTTGESTTILTSTYPVYVLTHALTAGVPDIKIEMLGTGDASCLHDYTLSVSDMKLLENADVLALNGAGLEDFMDDALAQSSAIVIRSADGVVLAPSMSNHDHENDHNHEGEEDDHKHEGEEDAHNHEDETADTDGETMDPHFWLDPLSYADMMDTIATDLSVALPQHTDTIQSNAKSAKLPLTTLATEGIEDLSALENRDLITFHDGFAYFARQFDLTLLASIEEEAGSEASAQEIAEIIAMVNDHSIKAIFTEVNGSDATAKAIARETGCDVASLNLLMSGDSIAQGLTSSEIISTYYVSVVEENISTIAEALA